MKVIRDNLWLCSDCMMATCNGDLSGIPADRHPTIIAGLAKLGPHLVSDFDAETGKGLAEWSYARCACCESTQWGSRHRFAILGEG